MKTVIILLLACVFCITLVAQQKVAKPPMPDSTQKVQKVEAACGECQFGLHGKGCHLAVRINGKAYFVDGTDIDSHGDAHASDGFCNTVRHAVVHGKLVNNRFKATYFKLIEKPAVADTIKR